MQLETCKLLRSRSFLQITFACFCLLVIVSAQAQDTSTDTADSPEDSPETLDKNVFRWETSTPVATDFDWVQLVSGEWLKGEIKGLFEDSLEFDSDKLDLLSLDWEDVKYVETHIPGSAYIEGHGTVYGFFVINQEKIIVTNGGEPGEYDRSKLVAFITGGEEESDYWSAKITFGLIVRSGNTDQVDYNAKANIKRQTSFSRFTLDYVGNISNTQDIETINNHRVSATADRFLTRNFFWRPIFGEYYRDPFSNIDSRVTVGTGAGYTIIDTSRTNWNITGGPGYQSTHFVSVEVGDDIKQTTPAMVVTTDYDIEINKKLDFIYSYNITWVENASGGYTHHMVTTFENEITGSFDLDVSFIWDHISKPTAADDGTVPLSDDYRLTVGISYDY
jgi:putative salt-induced outer membrane protein YdiY